LQRNFLTTERVCRYYRRGTHVVRAVDDVTFTLHKGEFLGIVGASGSGKSTLLNLLAGIDTATSGRIFFEKIPLDALARRKLAVYRARRIGMIFQSFNLLPHHTALGNVELALYFNNTPHRERKKRAIEILERLGLSDRIDHKPADLSGGEQQRVAIARALVKKPEILLADEPTGNLDRENTGQIAELLTEFNHDGLAVIIVTHDIELASRCAGRILKMHYGRIVEEISGPGKEGNL